MTVFVDDTLNFCVLLRFMLANRFAYQRLCLRQKRGLIQSRFHWLNLRVSECGTPPARDLLLNYDDPAVQHRRLMHLPCHTVSRFPSLDCFCQNFPKVSEVMTTTSKYCLLLVIFVRTRLCMHPSLLDPNSVPCAWLVTIPLEVVLHQMLPRR